MIVLGIESSCDETAASIVRDGRIVVSSVVASQTETHAEYGGVVPEIASRLHEINILPVIRRAMDEGGVGYGDLDAIAVGHRPGLVGALLVGVSAAKALSWSTGVPLVGVDHVQAHLYAPFLVDGDGGGGGGVVEDRVDPEGVFPALGMVISGGHTSMYRMESATEMVRIGATIDDAIGEAFDKAASILGLAYPGGPEIDRLARMEGADDRVVELPVSRLGKGSLDFSYSGLKTALLYAAKGKPNPPKLPGKPQRLAEPAPELTDARVRDLAATFERSAVRALTLKAGWAMDANPDIRTVILGGGVSANSLVRSAFEGFGAERGVGVLIPKMAYCVDNGAMIGGLGGAMFAVGVRDDLGLSATPTTGC